MLRYLLGSLRRVLSRRSDLANSDAARVSDLRPAPSSNCAADNERAPKTSGVAHAPNPWPVLPTTVARSSPAPKTPGATGILGHRPASPPPSTPPGTLNNPARTTSILLSAASAPATSSSGLRATVGRNDPCPCGSGKKYKKCHGVAPPATATATPQPALGALVAGSPPKVSSLTGPNPTPALPANVVLSGPAPSAPGATGVLGPRLASPPPPPCKNPAPTISPKLPATASAASSPAVTAKASGNGPAPNAPSSTSNARLGRNDPCPCGSGKKYKKCHGVAAPVTITASSPQPPLGASLTRSALKTSGLTGPSNPKPVLPSPISLTSPVLSTPAATGILSPSSEFESLSAPGALFQNKPEWAKMLLEKEKWEKQMQLFESSRERFVSPRSSGTVDRAMTSR
jgi:hypothetical protein